MKKFVFIMPQNHAKRWTLHHANAFLLTFFSYAFFHATRKTFSNVKDTILDEWTPEFHNETVLLKKPDYIWSRHHMFYDRSSGEIFLGYLDTTFMISYAVGLFVSGVIGDVFNLRYVLSLGMLLSSMIVILFGCVTEWLHYYHTYSYIILFALNGLIQSSGWPAVIAVMGNWFGKSSRGWVMGFWSACASIGNIFGSLVSAAVVDYGYEYTFLVTGAALGAFGIVVFFGLVPNPEEVGLSSDSDEQEDLTVNVSAEREPLLQPQATNTDTVVREKREKPFGLIKAFLLPGVAQYSLAYACLKLVNYAFFFWLPFYLSSAFNWQQSVADDISIWYDVGGIVGGIITGYLSDILGKRSIVVQITLILSFPALYVYSVSPPNKVTNSVLLAVAGFFVGGAANLISAAITADLGRQEAISGNARALATVSGIVDGTGSVGAAIGQFLVPEIQEHFDWHWVFYFFLLMNFLTMLCFGRISIQETRDLWYRWRQSRAPSVVVNEADES